MVKLLMAGAALVTMTAAPAVAQVPRPAEAEQVRARQSISMMEGVLERAVMNGADNLLRQIDTVMPDGAMLTGAPQVRGFRLDGYGVFFDVEVPALRLSIAWVVRSLQSGSLVAGSALADLKAGIGRMEPSERDRMTVAIQRLELALGVSASPSGPRLPARGGVSAASAFQPAQPPLQGAVAENPNEVWTREVKTALVEAMLGYSGPLQIGDEEWLTVAARDNVPADPMVPGDTVDFSTVIFRVKGSDLAALHSRRLTLEEARNRVEVREY
jgi:hypothetical protein